MRALLLAIGLLAALPLLLSGCGGPSAEAHFEAGVQLQEQGQTEQAIKEFDEAIRIDPKLPDARVRRAEAFSQSGEFGRALQDYDEAVRLGAKTAPVYNNRGLSYLNQDQAMKAMENFNLAIQVDPDFGPAYYNRGLAHYNMVMEPKDKALDTIKEVDQAIRLNPTEKPIS